MPQLSHQKKNGTSGRYLLYAFLLNLVIAIFAFVFSIASQGGLFSLAGDLNSQQINFITHGIEVLREGSAGFDYSIDLGSDFIGSMAFYILGNPSFYLASLFPPDMLMYVMGWIYVLKYALAGLTSFIFIRRFVENPSAAVVASVMYAFSGFMNTNLLFYHFHDVVLLFPLMLITLDDLIEKNRRGPFIAAVFLNAIVSYYFLPGEVIFLALYFVVRYLPADFGKYIKKLPSILFEGVLGCAAGMTLLLPAFLSVINNPRVEVGYSGSNALVYSEQRYLLILKGILFPGEIMSRQSAVYDTNYGSYSVYLPMVGMILVLVFIAVRKRHWISRLLKLSLVFALIPILNASFSLFAGVYARWYYMPILIMTSACAVVMDEFLCRNKADTDNEIYRKNIVKASVIQIAALIGFCAFLFFVKWDDNTERLIYHPKIFAVFAGISLIGSVLTLLILLYKKRMKFLFFGGFVCIFALVTTFGLVYGYRNYAAYSGNEIKDRLEAYGNVSIEDCYRIDTDDNYLDLGQGVSGRGTFCSTVSGSIFEFYDLLGLKRTVKSPEAPEGLKYLISAAYSMEDEPISEKEYTQMYESGDFVCYEYFDPDVPKIGFTYDTYITESEIRELDTEKRVKCMLAALVVPDDFDGTEGMNHFDAAYVDNLPDYQVLAKAHMNEMSEEFTKDSDGFRSVITSASEKYAYFSIPDDKGWTAFVNGEETEIVDSAGMMAVRIESGRNEIEFRYETVGLKEGVMVTATAVIISAVYLIAFYLIKMIKRKRSDSR